MLLAHHTPLERVRAHREGVEGQGSGGVRGSPWTGSRAAVWRRLSGTTGSRATLLYGAGLRLLEGLRLRVKDVDCPSHHLVVGDGTGHQERVTRLPQTSNAP